MLSAVPLRDRWYREFRREGHRSKFVLTASSSGACCVSPPPVSDQPGGRITPSLCSLIAESLRLRVERCQALETVVRKQLVKPFALHRIEARVNDTQS